MNTPIEMDHAVEITDPDERLSFLPNFFGPYAQRFETLLYDVAASDIAGYRGGYWRFFTVTVDEKPTPLVVLDTADKLQLSCEGNGFDKSVTPLAASVGMNLVVLIMFANALYGKDELWGERFAEMFYALRAATDYLTRDGDGIDVFSYID